MPGIIKRNYAENQRKGGLFEPPNRTLLKPRDDSSLNTIANEVHTWNPPTCGHVTRDGLIDLKGSGETVYQQGKTTCTTEHQVRDVDYPSNEEWNACFQDTDRTVRVTNKVENGDSGGPILREHYNMDGQKELSIIAPTWATLDDPAVTMGCAAYWIHGDQLVEFGPDC